MPIKLITWNIQCGRDDGPRHNGWGRRKDALASVLQRERPEVLCVQEALPEQLAFLDRVMSGHDRVGHGRDGGSAGEHCAIYFDRSRLALEDSRTFWLGEQPDTGGHSWDGPLQRIVTWARLTDRRSGESFRVYNTHFPLNPAGRRKSAELLLSRIADVCEPMTIVGDFNCGPRSGVWRSFYAAGLKNTEAAVRASASATFRLWKFGIACLDGVFACDAWRVVEHRVLRDPVGAVFPSDHFGVAVRIQNSKVAQLPASP